MVFNLQSYRNFPFVFTVFTSGFCFITKHVKLRGASFGNTKQNICFSSKKKKHIFMTKSKELVERLRDTTIVVLLKNLHRF